MVKILRKHRQRQLANLLIIIGIVAALAVAGLLLQKPRANVALIPPNTNQSVPSSEKPSKLTVTDYSVAPDLPKYISTQAIDLAQTRVMHLGLTENNRIASPKNIYDAGWYKQSAKPGQPGAMFIYGHVSSWQANGAFYNLKNLKTGDTVTVTNGADKEYAYRVVSSKVYPYNNVDMDAVLSPVDSQPGLNLMTCAGKIIKGTSEFEERLVVFTSLVKN